MSNFLHNKVFSNIFSPKKCSPLIYTKKELWIGSFTLFIWWILIPQIKYLYRKLNIQIWILIFKRSRAQKYLKISVWQPLRAKSYHFQGPPPPPPDFSFKFKELGSKKFWRTMPQRVTPQNPLAHGLYRVIQKKDSTFITL